MKKRLNAAARLMHLQDQKVRLAEMDLVRLKQAIADLEDEAQRLHEQIDGTIGADAAIMDLMFRRLDQLARQRSDKYDEISATMQRLTREKIRGEAATRLRDDVSGLLQEEADRQSLMDIIERVSSRQGSSFR